jgi:hypothetical protein
MKQPDATGSTSVGATDHVGSVPLARAFTQDSVVSRDATGRPLQQDVEVTASRKEKPNRHGLVRQHASAGWSPHEWAVPQFSPPPQFTGNAYSEGRYPARQPAEQLPFAEPFGPDPRDQMIDQLTAQLTQAYATNKKLEAQLTRVETDNKDLMAKLGEAEFQRRHGATELAHQQEISRWGATCGYLAGQNTALTMHTTQDHRLRGGEEHGFPQVGHRLADSVGDGAVATLSRMMGNSAFGEL